MNADTAKVAILDEMIAGAEDRVAELGRQIDLENRFLDALKTKRSSLASEPHVHQQNGTLPANRVAMSPVVAHRPISTLVEEVMRSAPRPMKLSEIAAGVEDRGGHTDAKKGMISLISSILYRYGDSKYRRVGPSLYEWYERGESQTTTGDG
jgi:hypothetical protein